METWPHLSLDQQDCIKFQGTSRGKQFLSYYALLFATWPIEQSPLRVWLLLQRNWCFQSCQRKRLRRDYPKSNYASHKLSDRLRAHACKLRFWMEISSAECSTEPAATPMVGLWMKEVVHRRRTFWTELTIAYQDRRLGLRFLHFRRPRALVAWVHSGAAFQSLPTWIAIPSCLFSLLRQGDSLLHWAFKVKLWSSTKWLECSTWSRGTQYTKSGHSPRQINCVQY